MDARGDGSPPPSTACSANLRGQRDETSPHHSLRTGKSLTCPRKCYSEATCGNLLVSQCRPLVTCSQRLRDMARNLDSNTQGHVVLLTSARCDNVIVDFLRLCITLRRRSPVTSGVRTEGGLRFGALGTEPVARHFLTNVCMALVAGGPLPGSLLPKISRVSLMDDQ